MTPELLKDGSIEARVIKASIEKVYCTVLRGSLSFDIEDKVAFIGGALMPSQFLRPLATPAERKRSLKRLLVTIDGHLDSLSINESVSIDGLQPDPRAGSIPSSVRVSIGPGQVGNPHRHDLPSEDPGQTWYESGFPAGRPRVRIWLPRAWWAVPGSHPCLA